MITFYHFLSQCPGLFTHCGAPDETTHELTEPIVQWTLKRRSNTGSVRRTARLTKIFSLLGVEYLTHPGFSKTVPEAFASTTQIGREDFSGKDFWVDKTRRRLLIRRRKLRMKQWTVCAGHLVMKMSVCHATVCAISKIGGELMS